MTARTPDESLKAQFEALHAERVRTWDTAQLERNVEQRRKLVAAFDPARAVKVGDRVAPFELEDSQGGRLTLAELIGSGPMVLVFFRYAGCPACNLALPYYDRQLRPALDALGVPLVAVSPHLPEKGLDEIRVRHGLGFRVAVDRDNALARRFGISFARGEVPEGQPTPGWIGELTGTGTAELPQPTIIVIDGDATVRFVDVSPDWLDRAEATDVLAVLDRISAKAAA